jgi:hypothetical protein
VEKNRLCIPARRLLSARTRHVFVRALLYLIKSHNEHSLACAICVTGTQCLFGWVCVALQRKLDLMPWPSLDFFFASAHFYWWAVFTKGLRVLSLLFSLSHTHMLHTFPSLRVSLYEDGRHKNFAQNLKQQWQLAPLVARAAE